MSGRFKFHNKKDTWTVQHNKGKSIQTECNKHKYNCCKCDAGCTPKTKSNENGKQGRRREHNDLKREDQTTRETNFKTGMFREKIITLIQTEVRKSKITILRITSMHKCDILHIMLCTCVKLILPVKMLVYFPLFIMLC